MSNLFILGNGFDLAHGLNTSYKNFKKFLWEHISDTPFFDGNKYPRIKEMPEMPLQPIYTSKGKLYNLIEECQLLYWLIDEAATCVDDLEWNQFETLLGNLDYNKVFDNCENNENVAAILIGVLGTLEEVFFEWISTIQIKEKSNAKMYLTKIISSSDDLAISFNYTETIEEVYKLKEENVCYIHGKRENDRELKEEKGISSFGKDNERLIVGYSRMGYDPNKKFTNYQGTDRFNKLISVDTYLQKDSEGIIYSKRDFYDKIEKSNIDNIFSFGFSYSLVDQPQIRELCRVLNGGGNRTKAMTWYLNIFDEKGHKNEKYKEIVRGLGFEGQFALYDADSLG